MEPVDYRTTQLWADAKSLVLETYRVTSGWSPDGDDIAKDLRSIARMIAKNVPGAFKKGGMTGNIHLQMSLGYFAELEALCDVAGSLGYIEPGAYKPLIDASKPVESKFRELHKASKTRAKELMKKRTSMFGGSLDDDDED